MFGKHIFFEDVASLRNNERIISVQTPQSPILIPTIQLLLACQTVIGGITGLFEGAPSLEAMYKNLTGDFDGMGLSAGVLQWNYGSGSLQPMLQEYLTEYGKTKLDSFFKEVKGTISQTASMSTAAARQEALKWQSNTHLNADWATAWKNFLSSPEFKNIQNKYIKAVWDKACAYAIEWNMGASLRAQAFFFDIVTQNGAMKNQRGDITPALIEKKLQDAAYIPKIITDVTAALMTSLPTRINGDVDFLGIKSVELTIKKTVDQLNALTGVHYAGGQLYFDCRATQATRDQVKNILAASVAGQIDDLYQRTPVKVNFMFWNPQDILKDQEMATLFAAAYERARISNPDWWLDVFNRKGTVAIGQGRVHTDVYDFRALFSAKSPA